MFTVKKYIKTQSRIKIMNKIKNIIFINDLNDKKKNIKFLSLNKNLKCYLKKRPVKCFNLLQFLNVNCIKKYLKCTGI